MNRKSLVFSAAVAVVSACAAYAAADHREDRFPISLDDVKAEAALAFAGADADADGLISAEEFVAAKHPRMAHGPGRMSREGMPHGHRMRPRMGPPTGLHPRMERGHDEMRDPEARRERMLKHEQALFETADANGDGVLSLEEFHQRDEAMRKQMQARMFERLDTDSSGALDATEFPPQLRRLESLDANGDGTITRDELPRERRHRDDSDQDS